MGHEFQVSLSDGSDGSLPALAAHFRHTGRYAVQAINSEVLTLRFSAAPQRPSWPEDILMKRNEDGLYGLIHTGSGGQRKSFWDDLNEICNPSGRIEIEEL